MRQSKSLRHRRVATAALTLALAALPAFGVRLVSPQVTGRVTSISGNVSVVIDGKTYMIGAGTPASQNIANVHVGDQIGLILDGPVSRSGSHVINIQKVSKP
jgi:hypothetical protein